MRKSLLLAPHVGIHCITVCSVFICLKDVVKHISIRKDWVGTVGTGLPTATSNAPISPTGAPTLIQHHNAVIHSPDLTTTGASYDPRNQTGIIRRAIMNTPEKSYSG